MNANDEPNVMSRTNRLKSMALNYTRKRIFRGRHPGVKWPLYEDAESITGGQDTFDMAYTNWKPSMK